MRPSALTLLLGVVGAATVALIVVALTSGQACLEFRSSSPQSIRLILVRHAQSVNNARWYLPLFLADRDPVLTAKGEAQGRAAAEALRTEQPDLVFSSVLLRAMQTAALAFSSHRVLVAPHISEVGLGCFLSPGSCTLSRAEQIAALDAAGFNATLDFDWSLVDASSPEPATSWPAFVQWMWAQPQVQALLQKRGESLTIAVVSHGNFLQFNVLPCGWAHPHNTQTYSATLDVPTGDEVDSQPRDVYVMYDGGE